MNPCDLVEDTPVTAAFSTSYEMGWQDSIIRFEVDTFLTQFSVIFTALQEDAKSYSWKVGDDPRIFDEREFTLMFNDFTGDVDVQLIIEATPNLECFPTDDGRDTVNQTIVFVEKMQSEIFGMYEGVIESVPSDTFVIDVFSYPPYFESNNIDNFPKGCFRDEAFRLSFLPGYRNFVMPELTNYLECSKPRGWGKISYDNILTIDYLLWNSEKNVYEQNKFNGIKIN